MVSTRSLISKSSSPSTNPLVTVSSAPLTISIPVTFMLHSFFQISSKVKEFIFLFSQFYPVVSRHGKVHYSAASLFFRLFISIFLFFGLFVFGGGCFVFFFCWLSQGLVVWPRLGDPFVSQNPKEFCASHFPGQILGCAYTTCSYGQI